MTKESLIAMWKIVSMNDLLKTGNMAVDEVMSHVNESIYYPIDTKHCVVDTDGLVFLLMQENGVVFQTIEAGDLDLSKLIK